MRAPFAALLVICSPKVSGAIKAVVGKYGTFATPGLVF